MAEQAAISNQRDVAELQSRNLIADWSEQMTEKKKLRIRLDQVNSYLEMRAFLKQFDDFESLKLFGKPVKNLLNQVAAFASEYRFPKADTPTGQFPEILSLAMSGVVSRKAQAAQRRIELEQGSEPNLTNACDIDEVLYFLANKPDFFFTSDDIEQTVSYKEAATIIEGIVMGQFDPKKIVSFSGIKSILTEKAPWVFPEDNKVQTHTVLPPNLIQQALDSGAK